MLSMATTLQPCIPPLSKPPHPVTTLALASSMIVAPSQVPIVGVTQVPGPETLPPLKQLATKIDHHHQLQQILKSSHQSAEKSCLLLCPSPAVLFQICLQLLCLSLQF